MALAHVLARAPDAKTVLVIATSARDHVDHVAAGLGAVAAQSGQRVAVIHRNGHSPDKTDLSRMRVAAVNAGTALYGNGGGISAFQGEAARQESELDMTSNDLVLVSAPSPDSSPAALTLGRKVKQAVLVSTIGVTRFGDARRTAELLRESGIRVVAGILVPRDT
jgi:Mrp family chromosome partitioning ATPase